MQNPAQFYSCPFFQSLPRVVQVICQPHWAPHHILNIFFSYTFSSPWEVLFITFTYKTLSLPANFISAQTPHFPNYYHIAFFYNIFHQPSHSRIQILITHIKSIINQLFMHIFVTIHYSETPWERAKRRKCICFHLLSQRAVCNWQMCQRLFSMFTEPHFIFFFVDKKTDFQPHLQLDQGHMVGSWPVGCV